MVKGVPHNLMKATCKFCGRRLRYAKIPNRGPVMVHGKGEGEMCRRAIWMGTDLISRAEARAKAQAEQEAARARARAALEARLEASK